MASKKKTDQERIDELANKKLVALLTIVDPQSIVSIKKTGQVDIGGVPATPEVLANLRAEAEFFMESELWKLIHDKVAQEAQRIMFVSGESLEEMKTGRSMLYLLDMQKTYINIFRSYNPKK